MELTKHFIIHQSKDGTHVARSPDLGRILGRPEVAALVTGMGSELRGSAPYSSVEIVPPLPKKRLKALGDALVKITTDLDPTPPEPSYEIRP